MKKKIRDLTSEEYGKWELKNCSGIDCRDCPFKYVNCKCEMWVNHKDMYSNKFLDQEVDIPSPHILDKKEHDYLRAVVKPYKIKSITLIGDLSTVCLKVRLENNINEWFELPYFKKDSFELPYFKKGSMYKSMEVYKEYSIQDLELDKEWNNEN